MAISALFKPNFGRHAKWMVLLGIAFVLIGLGIGLLQQIKNQLNDWKLLPEPEKLTELYFTHPNNLPATYRPGQTQTLSFTVHNIEHKTMTYHYKITEAGQNHQAPKTIRQGSFTLRQNQYRTVTASTTLADLGSRVKITADLPTANESIDYWVNRSSA